VLGYEKIMMPPGVGKISDFIHTLDNFSRYAEPVLSIDSYDQSIYTTELLASLSKYGKKQHQQMGFYFIPFAVWTWKNAMDRTPVAGTSYTLKEVILKDKDGNPITYKDGDWGAFPLDPTHPATRLSIISQLLKAKAIHATFLKIDFLSAGALESSSRFDPSVRSGIQAYNQGMKMLKHLIDSILGPDIFITQAISPLFPHQYAHTRFISTDVYSHLRDDEPGFPSWGSTESSLATGSHLWWVQGTLWPYTNLDVSIMKNFEKNPDLSEQEIKVRIFAMMVMGSILGDGSDFRQPLAAERAKKFLNNPAVCAFFSHPSAFTPLQFADGDGFDQQMAFYLKSGPSAMAGTDAPLLALFNFSKEQPFKKSISLETLGLPKGKYILKDFMTDAVLGTVENDQEAVSLAIPEKDAWLMKIIKE
jgi:alpha-galactosidase